MTASAQTTDERIQTYLSQLNTALAGIATPEKDEILREIRAHILDSIAASPRPRRRGRPRAAIVGFARRIG